MCLLHNNQAVFTCVILLIDEAHREGSHFVHTFADLRVKHRVAPISIKVQSHSLLPGAAGTHSHKETLKG